MFNPLFVAQYAVLFDIRLIKQKHCVTKGHVSFPEGLAMEIFSYKAEAILSSADHFLDKTVDTGLIIHVEPIGF